MLNPFKWLFGGNNTASLEQMRAERDAYKDTLDTLASQIRKSYGSRTMSTLSLPAHGYSMSVAWTSNRAEEVKHFRYWVYIAVNRICEIVAGTPPRVSRVEYDTAPLSKKRFNAVMRRKAYTAVREDQDMEPVDDLHPLVQLFHDPNGPDVSWKVWYELAMFYRLTGNAYIWLPENAFGLPHEMYIIPSHWVWPQAGEGGEIVAYHIRPIMGSASMISLPANEVIHMMHPSPISKVDGWSPLTAGARWIDTEESISTARWASFKNGAFPSFAVEMDKEAMDPTPEMVSAIEQRFLAKFQGESKYGKPIILSPGLTLTPLSITPDEMGYVQSAEQMRDFVLNLFGIPKALIDPESTTYGATAAALSAFCTLTLKPFFTYLGQLLTEKLAHRFDPTLKVWWPDPSPDDPTQALQERQAAFAAGALTPNEWRIACGQEPYQHGGDDPVLNGQEVNWGTGKKPEPQPGEGEGGGQGPQPPPGEQGAGKPGEAAEAGKSADVTNGPWALQLPSALGKDADGGGNPIFPQQPYPADEKVGAHGLPVPDYDKWFKRGMNGHVKNGRNGHVKKNKVDAAGHAHAADGKFTSVAEVDAKVEEVKVVEPRSRGVVARLAGKLASTSMSIGAKAVNELRPSSIVHRVGQTAHAIRHPYATVVAAKDKAIEKFKALRERYGTAGATAIAGAYAGYYVAASINPAIMLYCPSPTAVLLGSAEAIRYGTNKIRGKSFFDEPMDYVAEVREFLADLCSVTGEECPELNEDILVQVLHVLLTQGEMGGDEWGEDGEGDLDSPPSLIGKSVVDANGMRHGDDGRFVGGSSEAEQNDDVSELAGVSLFPKTSRKTASAFAAVVDGLERRGLKLPPLVLFGDSKDISQPAESRHKMIRVNPDEVAAVQKLNAEAMRKVGKPYLVDPSLEGIIRHELTHNQFRSLPENEQEKITQSAREMMTGSEQWLSMRAEANVSEFISEIGSAFLGGKPLPPQAEELAGRVWGAVRKSIRDASNRLHGNDGKFISPHSSLASITHGEEVKPVDAIAKRINAMRKGDGEVSASDLMELSDRELLDLRLRYRVPPAKGKKAIANAILAHVGAGKGKETAPEEVVVATEPQAAQNDGSIPSAEEKEASDFPDGSFAPNPGNLKHGEHWIKDVKVKGATLSFELRGDNTIELYSIRVPAANRGKGIGRAAMDSLLKEADKRNLKVKLLASPLDKKTKLGQLVKFYESFGFKVAGRGNPAGDPIMIREPKSQSSEVVAPTADVLAAVKKLHTSDNLIPLADLRDSLASMDRKAQDAALRELQRSGKLSFVGLEGRHGISQREQEAMLEGRVGYVAMKAWPKGYPTKGFEDEVKRDEKGRFAKKESTTEEDAPAGIHSAAFKAWFGESKIVNDVGEPKVMYRGSPNENAAAHSSSGMIFLTEHPKFAENYAKDGGQVFEVYVSAKKPFDASRGEGYQLWKRFVKETDAASWASGSTERGALPFWTMEKELRTWLDANGVDYDAIYFAENDRSSSLAVLSEDDKKKRTALGVLSPTQIKSTTNTTFDPTNPSIYKSVDANGMKHAADGKFAGKDAENNAANTTPHAAAKERLASWLASSSLPDDKANQYSTIATRVLDKMPEAAISRLLANTYAATFVASMPAMQEAYTRIAGVKPKGKVGAFWASGDDGTGELFLDGGKDTGEQYDTRSAAVKAGIARAGVDQRPQSADDTEGIYAHEFAHAVDGTERELSGSAEWVEAWKEEIDKFDAPLSKYACSSAVEGFAEFARACWLKPDETKAAFPKCFAFWQAKGLV